MILSILICTLEDRQEQMKALRQKLDRQKSLCELMYGQGIIEVLEECDNRQATTGAKRNKLLERAKGKYSVFIDDDDDVPNYYIESIVLNAHKDVDCFAINGTMTTNGANEKKWFIALGNPYVADHSTGEEIYLRPPNHLCPMKTEIARQIGFPDVTRGEDYDFCMRLQQSGLLKTQYVIEKPMYHYQYKDK
jgi:hypothetical protein